MTTQITNGRTARVDRPAAPPLARSVRREEPPDGAISVGWNAGFCAGAAYGAAMTIAMMAGPLVGWAVTTLGLTLIIALLAGGVIRPR